MIILLNDGSLLRSTDDFDVILKKYSKAFCSKKSDLFSVRCIDGLTYHIQYKRVIYLVDD